MLTSEHVVKGMLDEKDLILQTAADKKPTEQLPVPHNGHGTTDDHFSMTLEGNGQMRLRFDLVLPADKAQSLVRLLWTMGVFRKILTVFLSCCVSGISIHGV